MALPGDDARGDAARGGAGSARRRPLPRRRSAARLEVELTAAAEAVARLETFFLDRETRPGVLARELCGRPKPGDARLAALLCAGSRSGTRFDGSIGGSLARTSWAAWEMMDLGMDPLEGGLDRLVSWVLTVLESGTSAPEPAPLTMPNGLVFTDAEGAAFAARCLGLRVLIRARREERPGVARMIDEIAGGPQAPTLDRSACVLAALALVPPPHRRHLDGLVNRIGAAQTPRGDWADADLFHVLEALILAGVRSARAVIARAAPALLARQRADGAFDDPPHEERAWIGLRALRVALEE